MRKSGACRSWEYQGIWGVSGWRTLRRVSENWRCARIRRRACTFYRHRFFALIRGHRKRRVPLSQQATVRLIPVCAQLFFACTVSSCERVAQSAKAMYADLVVLGKSGTCRRFGKPFIRQESDSARYDDVPVHSTGIAPTYESMDTARENRRRVQIMYADSVILRNLGRAEGLATPPSDRQESGGARHDDMLAHTAGIASSNKEADTKAVAHHILSNPCRTFHQPSSFKNQCRTSTAGPALFAGNAPYANLRFQNAKKAAYAAL